MRRLLRLMRLDEKNQEKSLDGHYDDLDDDSGSSMDDDDDEM